MKEQISTHDRIRMEARQAAAKWTDINAACPYPWGSVEAAVFKREFHAEQQALAGSEMMCACPRELSAADLEAMRCSDCGKAVVA